MDKQVMVKLNTQESGTLCHVLLKSINDYGGPHKVPPFILDLYEKLAKANDRAMGKRR